MQTQKEKNNEEKVVFFKDLQSCKEVISKKDFNFCCKAAEDWLVAYDDARILGIGINKLKDVVIALYHHGTIYLIGCVYQSIMYAPKLLFHMEFSSNDPNALNVDTVCLHIDDVLMKHNSVGNGTIAMHALLQYAYFEGVDIITGCLSDVDADHQDRRNAYYKKFGFTVEKHRIIKVC